MPISLRLSLIAIVCSLVATVGEAAPGRLPARALVLYQALENAGYSLRITPEGKAEYLVWSNGRVREHHAGDVPRTDAEALLARISSLPPLAPLSSGRPGHAGGEREVDHFVILRGGDRIAGSLRQAPAAHAALLEAMKEVGRALPSRAVTGWYLWAEPVDPASADEDAEPLPFGGDALRQARDEALAYPYSPIWIAQPYPPATPEREPTPAHIRFNLLSGGGDPACRQESGP